MKTVYIYDNCITIKKQQERLVFSKFDQAIESEPIQTIQSILIFGNTQITTQAIKACVAHHINIIYCLKSGKLLGYLNSFGEQQCKTRLKQYENSIDKKYCLEFSKNIILEKTENQIKWVKKIRHKSSMTKRNIKQMELLRNKLRVIKTKQELMGLEGIIASIYFTEYGIWLTGNRLIRSRHPNKNYINSLLNLTYSLACSQISALLVAKGFDISIGFLHSIKNGRPSFACDILELYRSECDHFIANLVHRNEIKNSDFIDTSTMDFYLTDKGFKKYIQKYSQVLQPTINLEKFIANPLLYNFK